MTMNARAIDLDLPMRARPSFYARIGAFVSKFRRLMKNRHAVMSLAECDDAQLADIGVTRHEVNQVLQTAGLMGDPSRMLANAARTRAKRLRRIA